MLLKTLTSLTSNVLELQNTGSGGLEELVEEFEDGKVQYGFCKVVDTNSGLPKFILIGWCGDGVAERVKAYFTRHFAAVAKILHGSHVQVTARSEEDLNVNDMMNKVANASGSKYSVNEPSKSLSPQPIAATKPAAATSTTRAETNEVDEDGWGADAPPVTASELTKVETAYKPHKIDLGTGKSHERPEPATSSFKPVGAPDIAALRAQGKLDRPEVVKGAYEPIGKVDIAAIRAQATAGSDATPAQRIPSADVSSEEASAGRSIRDRSAAFQNTQSGRMSSLPKPKPSVSKNWPPSSSTGTKPVTPTAAVPQRKTSNVVTGMNMNFGMENGKTPAQQWAERKAREKGECGVKPTVPPIVPAEVASVGKGEEEEPQGDMGDEDMQEEIGHEPVGGVSALREKFKNTNINAGGAPRKPISISREESRVSSEPEEEDETGPAAAESDATSAPMLNFSNKPRAPPVEDTEEREEEAFDETDKEPQDEPGVPMENINIPAEEELQADDDVEARNRTELSQTQVVDERLPTETRGKRACVVYGYEKQEENELELIDGEMITEIEMVDEGWWSGMNERVSYTIPTLTAG